MNSARVGRIGFRFVVLTGISAILVAVWHGQRVHSQDAPTHELLSLERVEFDSPVSPIRNMFWAAQSGTFSFYDDCLDPSMDFQQPELRDESPAPEPYRSLTGLRVQSQTELEEGLVEIRAMPVGPDWDQTMPDVYTVAKTDQGWKIREARTYGPVGGSYGSVAATPDQNPDIDPLVGVWINENSNSGGISRIEIAIERNALTTRVWGQCAPFECYWGEASAQVDRDDPSQANVAYIKTFVNNRLTLRIIDGNRLECTYESQYKDASGRENRTTTEHFRRPGERLRQEVLQQQ